MCKMHGKNTWTKESISKLLSPLKHVLVGQPFMHTDQGCQVTALKRDRFQNQKGQKGQKILLIFKMAMKWVIREEKGSHNQETIQFLR